MKYLFILCLLSVIMRIIFERALDGKLISHNVCDWRNTQKEHKIQERANYINFPLEQGRDKAC